MDYRLRLKAGIHPVQRVHSRAIADGPFFEAGHTRTSDETSSPLEMRFFGWYESTSPESIPDWFRSPLTGHETIDVGSDWWSIPDFDPLVGDIKAIWEPSRFDWVVKFAQLSKTDKVALVRLNDWLRDWCQKNPPYKGPNWKCGQESSIRLINLALAAMILDEVVKPTGPVVDLVRVHLDRIIPTISYAVGQDNNHGTTEAAALFVGGTWLSMCGHADGRRYSESGRGWLEDRVARLILPDGTFSQYSTNYHRLALDTLSTAEVWRRFIGQPQFSKAFYARAAAASEWLRSMVDAATGDAPNLGENDGAQLLHTGASGFRDYRPSVQLGCALFTDRVAYPACDSTETLTDVFGVAASASPAPPLKSARYDEGGFAVLRRGDTTVVMRYPRFKFRPGHADVLHVDLSRKGRNLLRDSGTFSYSTDVATRSYFSGVQGHNTVQFDGREQMPRLSRFLWGDWLTTAERSAIVEDEQRTTFMAAYRDAAGAEHRRDLELLDRHLRVVDTLTGFDKRAVLRWRLQPGNWTANGTAVSNGRDELHVCSEQPLTRFEIVEGWESRFYLQRTPCPVLEVEVTEPSRLISSYRMAD